jgi:hypothetical protein
MAGHRGALAARLDRLESALGDQRMSFRTTDGRTFSLDITDVLGIMLDCLGWLHDDTAVQPRGRIVDQLARAVPHREGGLIGHTAIEAARRVVEGARP